MVEQHKFMKSKGIKIFTQAGIMLVNGSVFFANFFAIKKMAAADFPGFETGGALWFQNLLVNDPYLGLPLIAAVTTFISVKVGMETGTSAEQLTPGMRLALVYGFPAIILVSGYFFPAVSFFSAVF